MSERLEPARMSLVVHSDQRLDETSAGILAGDRQRRSGYLAEDQNLGFQGPFFLEQTDTSQARNREQG